MNYPIHKTEAIVLRTVKYGETSLIVTAFTELFGVQSYIIKGIRTASKKGNNKLNYFFPASVLHMQVYHHPQKQLQFIKDFEWAYISTQTSFNVIKNAVATFIVEMLLHSLKQPENNPSLFYFAKQSIMQTDAATAKQTANLPLWFCLQLANYLGFGISVPSPTQQAILDLQEGVFAEAIPAHFNYIEGVEALATAKLCLAQNITDIENISLNKSIRNSLLLQYQKFFQLHIEGFATLKSLPILSEILS